MFKSGEDRNLKKSRNLEAEADTEAMEGAAYWLTPHRLLSLLSYRTQDHQPRGGTTHLLWSEAFPNNHYLRKDPIARWWWYKLLVVEAGESL